MMKRYFILLVSVLALFACKKEEEFRSEGAPYFSIVVQDGGVLPVAELDPMSAQYTLNMGADAYSSTEKGSKHISKALRFRIYCNLRWKVLPADGQAASWVHPFPESGEKDGIFFFTADRNIDKENDREVRYNILVDDGSGVYEPLEGMLVVRQSKSDEFLEMSAAHINTTASAQTQKLRILSNVNWEYSISPMSTYGTTDLDWLTDLTEHTLSKQIDTLNLQLAENAGAIRGANIVINYRLNGQNVTEVVPLVQYPAAEVQLDGFPVKWVVRVAEQNTFSETFPVNGTMPPVSGTGMITFHNEAGKAADTQGNVKLDVSDNSPRATGVWPGDYCEFVAAAPVPAQSVIKLSFATRSSSGGMKYWRLEFRDGEEWKIAGTSYTDPNVKDPDGNPVVYTHAMNADGATNILVDAVVTYTQPTDQVEFRFICAANYRCSGSPVSGNPPAPNTGTWRLSVDTDSSEDDYQPSISVISAGSEPPTAANLSVTPSYLSFEAASSSTSKTFQVSSDQSFTINPQQSWIHVSTTQEYAGENISITVTCDNNTLGRIREGSISIVAGITRREVAVIQAGNAGGGGSDIPSKASFPIDWSMPAVSSNWVSGLDFEMKSDGKTGSYVCSDTHSGKLSVVRPAGTATGKSPNYRLNDDVAGYTTNYVFLHYGMNKDAYWLFEVYNVTNSAGTYRIQYASTASGAGPKCFILEYSTDGSSWMPINTKKTTVTKPDGTVYGEVTYTYMISPINNAANEALAVNETFHLGAISKGTLRVRARVSSQLKVDTSGDMATPTTGGTNRIFGKPKISFTAD